MAKKVEDRDTILFNRGECDFSFIPFGMSRYFNIPTNIKTSGMGLPINVSLLRNSLMSDIGLQRMFERGKIYINDEEVGKYLGIDYEKHPLIKEYQEIVEMLTKGTDAELDDYLNQIMDDNNFEACKGMVDIIERAAIDIKLNNLDKIELIQDYTGKLIKEILENMRLEDETKQETKKTSKKPTKNKKGTGFEE